MWPFKSKEDKEKDIMDLLLKRTISCRTCRALIWRSNAIQGEPTVKKSVRYDKLLGLRLGEYQYIDIPCYCLKCTPQKEVDIQLTQPACPSTVATVTCGTIEIAKIPTGCLTESRWQKIWDAYIVKGSCLTLEEIINIYSQEGEHD